MNSHEKLPFISQQNPVTKNDFLPLSLAIFLFRLCCGRHERENKHEGAY